MTLALALTGAASHAGEPGTIGLSVAVEGEGAFWNPTLKAVLVKRVAPGSPAAQAGIAQGDAIVEVEGRPVAGAKASELRPYMEREVGQRLRLVVKKPGGQLEPVELTAAARPR